MTSLPRPHPGIVPPTGLLVVDKPQGLTSHDVVARVRRLAGTKKVGHAGTLDPMATGVLVLGIGRATRLLTFLVGADKTYAATIRLGQSTVTDDAEGEVTATRGAAEVTPDAVRAGVARLTGAIEQVPSAVSAIKVDGQRSYARVRAGQEVALAARPVTIHRFEILGPPREATAPGGGKAGAADGVPVLDVDVLVECSSGTYIRALARDLGEGLGTGGHLTALRRERVGAFSLDDAATLDALAGAVQAANGAADRAAVEAGAAGAAVTVEGTESALPVLPLTEATTRILPSRTLDGATTRDLRIGRPIEPTGAPGPHAALAPDGHVVALIEDRDGRARPVLVFDPA